jgi:hypothetical protein
MWRIGRALAILAIGWFFLLAPAATAAPGASVHTAAPVGTAVVREQAPPPVGQPPASPGAGQPALSLENRRVVIGALGFVLIVVVLLSRRWRKLPMFGFTWKRKS